MRAIIGNDPGPGLGNGFLSPLKDNFDILLLHLFANFPMDDGAAESIEDGAKVVESTGDIEVGEVDMPMLMGLQRLLEASTFEGIRRLPSSHQTGLTEDLVGRRRANGDDVFIEHHVSQAPIAHLGMFHEISHNGLLFPFLQPMIAGDSLVVFINLTVAPLPFVVFSPGDADSGQKVADGQDRFNAPLLDKIDKLITHIGFNPFAF